VSKTSDREVNEVSDKIASLSELIVKQLVGWPTLSETASLERLRVTVEWFTTIRVVTDSNRH
jgi:hypothetical protein